MDATQIFTAPTATINAEIARLDVEITQQIDIADQADVTITNYQRAGASADHRDVAAQQKILDAARARIVELDAEASLLFHERYRREDAGI